MANLKIDGISITKRGDNSYRFTASLGFDEGSGKRIRRTETFKVEGTTQREINKELHDLAVQFKKKCEQQSTAVNPKIRLNDFVPVWESDWAVYNLTASQVDSYKNNYRLYMKDIIGSMRVCNIKKQDCQKIVNFMRDKELSPATIKRVVSVLSSILKYALDLELLSEMPFNNDRPLNIPKDKKSQKIHSFSVEETDRFLSALNMKYPKVYKSRKRKNGTEVNGYTSYHEISLQWRAYFALAVLGGFRKGEMVALTWADVDFENCDITINKAVANTSKGQILKEPKTESSYRTVHVPQFCIDLLEQWLDKQIEYSALSNWEGQSTENILQNNVFIKEHGNKQGKGIGTRMDLFSPTAKFPKILREYNALIEAEADKATTTEEKNKILAQKLPMLRLHDLRHCFATLLITNGIDIITVSGLMGHASPSITMDIYSHLLEKPAKQAAETFERILSIKVQKPAVTVSYMN